MRPRNLANSMVQEAPGGGVVEQLINNTLGVLLTWVLAAAGTFLILKVTDLTVGLRVCEEEEIEGLDLSQHGEEAYSLEG